MLLLASILLVIVLIVVLIVSGGGTPPAQTLAQSYVDAWAHGNYATMYADLTPAQRNAMSLQGFVAPHNAALGTATATWITPGSAGSPSGNGTVSVPVRVHTRLFGTLHLVFQIPTTGGDHPQVRWSSALVFPGLRPGETLTRHTALGTRGQLLARNGTPLASVSSASNVIGSLGPIPSADATEMQELGYPPDATVGTDGLEKEFEQQLAGTPGGELQEGTRPIGTGTVTPGVNVRTTLSPAMQQLAVTTLGAQTGSIVALLPGSGQIVAVAGTPFSDLQPPGSTFKIITVTGALLHHITTPSTVYPYATSADIDGYTLHNANGEDCGGTLANAFAVSCNSVFAPLGAKLGAANLVDAAQRFGFNQPSPIGFAAESTIPPGSLQSDLDVGSSAIGQGDVLATALQMALAAATIGDGGRRPTPTLAVNSVQPLVRVIPESVAAQVRKLMVDVVAFGTGTAAQIPGVVVAGKTGTAELTTTVSSNCAPGQTCGTGGPQDTDAWFVAFAPARHPRIGVGVLLPNDGAGGASAAPLAQTILAEGLRRTAGGGSI
jgi:cell division protein FtsI/penicillin-binding protein 2